MKCQKCGEEWISNEDLLSLLDKRLALLEGVMIGNMSESQQQYKRLALLEGVMIGTMSESQQQYYATALALIIGAHQKKGSGQ